MPLSTVQNNFKTFVWLVKVVVIAWLVSGCTWLDTQQRAAIYRPTSATASSFTAMQDGDEVVFLALNSPRRSVVLPADYAVKPKELAGDVESYISAWWLPSAKPDAPTILYFHGVFRNLTYNYEKFHVLRQAGFNVLAMTYRGWPGTSPLLPSEQSIFEDAARGFEELKLRQPDPAKRFIYGHSMGGGTAVDLASRLKYRRDYAGLMLESTFTRLADVGIELRWYGALLQPLSTQKFDSISKIKQVDAPILIRHGDADNTVPFVLGQRLFEAAPQPKEFVRFPGGSHSGLHAEQREFYIETAWQFWQRSSANK